MKILLVGNYLPDKQESMLRFTDLLMESLKPYGHEVKLIRPAVKVNRTGASFEERGRWWGYVDKLILFPFQLRKQSRWADIVHISDHSNSPYIRYVRNQPHVINCHDVIAIRAALNPLENSTKLSGRILQNMILKGLKQADHFACVSQNSREELLEVTGAAPDKATVIYNGMNYPFQKMTKAQAHEVLTSVNAGQAENFVLHVGGNQPYKNRMGVLRIYHHLRLLSADSNVPTLILAGKPWSDEMRSYIAESGLKNFVVEAQGCSDEEIRALYSLARVFIFPSLAEGFGWPVIEAQACGCPVLTSNVAPLTEIGGDAALYCDPRDEKEAAQQLIMLLNEDESAHQKRISDGLENVQRFTPQKMIEAYLALYQEIIEAHASGRTKKRRNH